MDLISGSDNVVKPFISLTDLNLTSKDDLNTYNQLLQLEFQRVNLKEQTLDQKEKRFKNKIDKMKANKSWNSELEQIAKELGEEAAAYAWMHMRAAHNCYQIGLAFSVAEIVLSTLVGGAILSTITETLDTLWFKIICSFIVWCVAVITGVQQNLDYSGLSTKHKTFAGDFSSLHYAIKEELCLYRRKRHEARNFIKSNTLLYNSLVTGSPDISDHIKSDYKKICGKNITIPASVDNKVGIITIKKESTDSDKREQEKNTECVLPNIKIDTQKNTECVLPNIQIDTLKKSNNPESDDLFRYRSSELLNKKIVPMNIAKENTNLDVSSDSYSTESDNFIINIDEYNRQKQNFEVDRFMDI